MDRKQIIFNEFIRANGLTSQPDFRNRRVLYHGTLFSEPMSAEDIQKTVEYSAFVDGIEGRSNVHEGPKRTPKPADTNDRRVANLTDVLASSLGTNLDSVRDIVIKVGLVEHYDLFRDKLPVERYNMQHGLGQARASSLRR